MSIRQESKAEREETGREVHNAWVDEQRYAFCPRCFEAKGIKRVMGWSAMDHPPVNTCPVCRYVESNYQPETRVEDIGPDISTAPTAYTPVMGWSGHFRGLPQPKSIPPAAPVFEEDVPF